MRGSGRLTNLALLSLLTLAFAKGWVAFELSGQPARAILVLHAAAGVAIVLLVPWKTLVARRGLHRPRPLRWGSLVLALGVLVSLLFGFVHSYSRRFDVDEAPRLLLATRLDGGVLASGHGFPVRLVVPGQRGFAWVKWVVSVEADPVSWWWQPPFPLQ